MNEVVGRMKRGHDAEVGGGDGRGMLGGPTMSRGEVVPGEG